jgi:hydroxyisourate hydrolase
MTDINSINQLTSEQLHKSLSTICTNQKWVHQVVAVAPYQSIEHFHEQVLIAYHALTIDDWKKIISGTDELISTDKQLLDAWSTQEQQVLLKSPDNDRAELLRLTTLYTEKFGFRYVICAIYRSAAQIIQNLLSRMHNNIDHELHIAAGERLKIIQSRINRWIAHLNPPLKTITLSTHILNTMSGEPAANMKVTLQQNIGYGKNNPLGEHRWITIHCDTTNSNGRYTEFPSLTCSSTSCGMNNYRLIFDVHSYFTVATLFPTVTIEWESLVDNKTHLHIPLLISPFAYSTYRGS